MVESHKGLSCSQVQSDNGNMKNLFIILGVIYATVAIESSAVKYQRKYYLNEVQVELSEDGEIFCEEVVPLLENHKFVTYLMGSHVEGKF